MSVAVDYETVEVALVKRRAPRKRAAVAPVVPAGPKFVARKTLRLNGRVIKPGTEVPEAASWPRVESWVRAGYLDVVEV